MSRHKYCSPRLCKYAMISSSERPVQTQAPQKMNSCGKIDLGGAEEQLTTTKFFLAGTSVDPTAACRPTTCRGSARPATCTAKTAPTSPLLKFIPHPMFHQKRRLHLPGAAELVRLQPSPTEHPCGRGGGRPRLFEVVARARWQVSDRERRGPPGEETHLLPPALTSGKQRQGKNTAPKGYVCVYQCICLRCGLS